MNIRLTSRPTKTSSVAITSASPRQAQGDENQEPGLGEKFLGGVQLTGLSMLPAVGGFMALRPLAFHVGMSGNRGGAMFMDVATLANYASLPLYLGGIVSNTSLKAAMACTALSGAAGLYGSLQLLSD